MSSSEYSESSSEERVSDLSENEQDEIEPSEVFVCDENLKKVNLEANKKKNPLATVTENSRGPRGIIHLFVLFYYFETGYF